MTFPKLPRGWRVFCSSPPPAAPSLTVTSSSADSKPSAQLTRPLAPSKRPPSRNTGENDSGGYSSDGESATWPGLRTGTSNAVNGSIAIPSLPLDPQPTPSSPFSNNIESNSTGHVSQGSTSRPRKKKKLDENKREERNAREKERSYRISKQINELRGLLSNGGVVVPKGTKSSVLSEAANYIRMLQQHQYRSEM